MWINAQKNRRKYAVLAAKKAIFAIPQTRAIVLEFNPTTKRIKFHGRKSAFTTGTNFR
jgi:hypothetical protein